MHITHMYINRQINKIQISCTYMFRIVNSSEPSDHVDPRVCDSGSGNADVLPEQRSILEHDRLFIH